MFLNNPPADADADVPNFERAFAQRPEVYAAWVALNTTIKAGMDPRRYELVSIAVARALTSSYCALAHATVALGRELATPDELLDPSTLPPADQAVIAFVTRIAGDATAITASDVSTLRDHGLGEQAITDVIVAATARCFFAKTLDATGAQPDAKYAALEPPALRDALTVGRPIAST